MFELKFIQCRMKENANFAVKIFGIFIVCFALTPFSVFADIKNTNTYVVSTISGGGNSFNEGIKAISAGLNNPHDVAVDVFNNIYIADTSETGDSKILKIDKTNSIFNVAGTGIKGYSGDGGKATYAQFSFACGVAADNTGNVYIADSLNNRIRKVDTNGIITTIAGNGNKGYAGDGGNAVSAELSWPNGITIDNSGNIYIADRDNNCIRKLNKIGVITTIAGNSSKGYSGDGGEAINAQLKLPRSVAVDTSGNIYIADTGNHCIRKVNNGGIITTVAGNGHKGFAGDGGKAISSALSYPHGVALDSNGNVYIADSYNRRIRMIDVHGIITTIAGGGDSLNDGVSATSAKLNAPWGVAVDSSGNVYIADADRIKKLTLK